MTQKNKDKKQWTDDPYDMFWGNKVRLDKKRPKSHNTIPAKFRHKEKKVNAKTKDHDPRQS